METLHINSEAPNDLFHALLPILSHRQHTVEFSCIANSVSLKNLFELISDTSIPEHKKRSLTDYLLSLDSVDSELLTNAAGHLEVSETAYDQHFINMQGILDTAVAILNNQ